MKNFRALTYLINTLFIAACLYPKVDVRIDSPLRIDYVVHFVAYLSLGLIALRGFSRAKLVTIAFITQGILIELIQPYTERSFELEDIAFNSLGATCAYFINRYYQTR